MKKVTVNNYKDDKYYPRVLKTFSAILIHNDEVKPIEVFQKMNLLSSEDLKNWYSGRIPFLERVIKTNLSKASRITRLIPFIAHDLNMKKIIHQYKKRGKGKKIILQFSKTNTKAIEEAYSAHYSIIGNRDKFIERNKQILWPDSISS